MSNSSKLLLIVSDPIFRLGLQVALEPFPDLVLEVSDATTIFNLPTDLPDLLILEFDLSRIGLQLQPLTTQYPNLPILLIGFQATPEQILYAKTLGIKGYCPQGIEVVELVTAIRQIVAGGTYWESSKAIVPTRPTRLRYQLRSSGIRQIDTTLETVESYLQNPNLSTLDWFFWKGRRRELLAARWLVNQILPTDVVIIENPEIKEIPESLPILSTSKRLISEQKTHQVNCENLTNVPLEIDILKEDKKQELFEIISRRIDSILEDLRYAQIQEEQLPGMRSRLLLDLWQSSLTEFFGKYYTLPVEELEIEVVSVLLKDSETIQKEILDKIPLIPSLFANLLFETSLRIDNVSYPSETPEAKEQSQRLLQNLIIRVANGVIQPLLNNFADVEVIKQTFYDRRLLSSREIARFRNNLSWKYRVEQYLGEPQAIFESRYELLFFTDIGISKTSIYAPRRQDLEELQGIALGVTLLLEFRDAIAPRLRGGIAFLGQGVVYILTQVIGRAIGLIGRGIIQGVGNTLQDTRYQKKDERRK